MAKRSKSNDEIIEELRDQVEQKKAQLAAAKVFNPKTNCSLMLPGGERVNIRTLEKDRLVDLLVFANSLKLSAMDLGVLEDYRLSGFPVQDWVDDLQSRLTSVNRSQEESRLKALEAKLYNLLSQDKKVALEIEDLKRQI